MSVDWYAVSAAVSDAVLGHEGTLQSLLEALQSSRSVLLVGASGRGKTSVVRTLCSVVGSSRAVCVDCKRLCVASEEEADPLFASALTSVTRRCSLLVLDALDAVCGAAPRNVVERRLSALLRLRIAQLQPIVCVATATAVDSLDARLLPLFPVRLELGALREEARFRLLMRLLGSDAAPNASQQMWMRVSEESLRGYSGGDMRKVVVWAKINCTEDCIEPDDIVVASKQIRPSALTSFDAFDCSHLNFAQVAGLQDAKALLNAAILMPLRRAEECAEIGITLPAGVIMYGPSGSGKTHLALALCGECGFSVINLSGTQVLSAIVGESERTVARVFSRARAVAPCIVLIDQLEAIAPKLSPQDGNHGQDAGVDDEVAGGGGGGGSGAARTQSRLVAAFVSELDRCVQQERGSVIVVGTTLNIELCHPRVVQRMDVHCGISAADLKQRECIVRFAMERFRVKATDEQISHLASMLDKRTSAATWSLCNEAALESLRVAAPALTVEHFEKVFQEN